MYIPDPETANLDVQFVRQAEPKPTSADDLLTPTTYADITVIPRPTWNGIESWLGPALAVEGDEPGRAEAKQQVAEFLRQTAKDLPGRRLNTGDGSQDNPAQDSQDNIPETVR
jgi:hypothetical protein